MKGTTTCQWLLLGKTELCGRSCMATYCAVHNAQIAKGGGTYTCQGCGKGVRTELALCKPCGAHTAYMRKYTATKSLITGEFCRLAAIDIDGLSI